MRPHGIDFGRYTTWARNENPPQPVDFVIAGLTSGNYTVPTFEANKDVLLKEKRKMAYHFYEPNYTALVQADLATLRGELIGAQAYWIDWEDTSYHTLDGSDVAKVRDIYTILKKRHKNVGVYSNLDDFTMIQRYDPELANEVEWWMAYPDNYPDRTDYPGTWGSKINRGFDTIRFLQYSWSGDAQLYGATNDKKSMDEDVFLGTMDELDAWLGITVEPPPTGCAEILKELMTLKKMNKDVRQGLLMVRDQIDLIIDKVKGE